MSQPRKQPLSHSFIFLHPVIRSIQLFVLQTWTWCFHKSKSWFQTSTQAKWELNTNEYRANHWFKEALLTKSSWDLDVMWCDEMFTSTSDYYKSFSQCSKVKYSSLSACLSQNNVKIFRKLKSQSLKLQRKKEEKKEQAEQRERRRLHNRIWKLLS